MAASTESMDVEAPCALLRREAASFAAAAGNPNAAVWKPLLDPLRSLTAAFVRPGNRDAVEPALFSCLAQLLGAMAASIAASDSTRPDQAVPDHPAPDQEVPDETVPDQEVPARAALEAAAECFRCLRNACVQCPANQRLAQDSGLIDAVAQLLLTLPPPPSPSDEAYFTAVRCGLQALSNVAAGNADMREMVWAATYPELYLKFLQCDDAKTLEYGCVVLHTSAGPSQAALLVSEPRGLLIARMLLGLCSWPNLQWPILMVTEHFLKSSILLAQLYEHLDSKLRLTLLDLLLASLAEEPAATSNEAFLMRLADELCATGSAVLRLASCADVANADEEAALMARTLSMLCEVTSEPHGDSCLRNHPTLLATAVGLLGECHRVGCEGNNAFSLVQGTAGFAPSANPAHGLKRDLVRLIGNMCFAHRGNQDQVRDLEGISLILESTNIDDNNPFIAQWAVLAVRNLTQGNVENQAVIRRLERRGAAQCPLLGALGVSVEEREGCVYVKATSKTMPSL